MKSYEQKILAWDGADFHELAASMDQEEIRSMVRQMFDECFYPNYDNASVENIVHDYLLLLAYEAEVAANEDEAEILYDIIFKIENEKKRGTTNMHTWRFACSIDADNIDYKETITCETEPDYWTCYAIAESHGCEFFDVQEVE